MADEQLFLLRLQRMCTSDDADLVAGWSAIVSEKDLDNIKLSDAATLTAISLKDCPLENVRPMTKEEVDEWRETDN